MAADRRIPEHLKRLLSSSIESVERLDILLFLRAQKPKSFSARGLGTALRVPSVKAEQHLAILCGRGFLTVTIGSDLVYAYQPVSPTIDAALAEIVDLNRERRTEVIAALEDGSQRDSLHAFANAFLIRKKDDKGDGNG
jgi:hypothetical protein